MDYIGIDIGGTKCAVVKGDVVSGVRRGSSNMLFPTFGTGLGAGLILDGRLYSGANGNAGEIGQRAGEALREICDISIVAPENETFKIQEYHLPIYHAFCAQTECILFE